MHVDPWMWGAFVGFILAMLAVDLLVLHRDAHEVSMREAGIWSAVWIGLALTFGALIWAVWGPEAGGQYLAGYLIEKSLSVDNIFVFALIFGYFAVPARYQHRVLFWGVLGALVFRAIFIAAGATLLEQFHWMIYVFGAFLVFTAVRMATARTEHTDPGQEPGAAPDATHDPDDEGVRRASVRAPRGGSVGRHPPPRGAGGGRDDRHRLRRGLDPGDLRRHR